MTALKIPSNLRWPLFVGHTVFLYILFTLPPEEIPEVMLGANDKLLHFINFFLLALLAFQALSYSAHSFFHLHAGAKAAGFSLLYGAYLEGCQLSVPGRSASFVDWVADAAGILVASGIFKINEWD